MGEAEPSQLLDLADIFWIVVDFFSEPWLGGLGILIGAIIAITVPRMPGRPAMLIAYHYARTRVLGAHNAKLPDDVTIHYRSKNIDSLSRTLLPIWHHGKQTIPGTNILPTDPARIELGDDVDVLDARIIKSTRPVTHCEVSIPADRKGAVLFGFQFLDPGDGFVVEIFHTDTTAKPALAGTIMGMPDGFRSFATSFPAHPSIYVGGALFGGFGIIGWILVIANAFVAEWTIKQILLGLFILGASTAGLAYGYIAIISRRRFPKSLDMREFRQ